MSGRQRLALGGGGLLLVLLGAGLARLLAPAAQAPQPAGQAAPEAAAVTRTAAVAALGRLDPFGEIHRLAAPISGLGVSPRLVNLRVQEGQRVRRGELLAVFDSAPGLRAQRSEIEARITNLQARLVVQRRDIERYRRLGRSGAIASADLDRRETDLLELEGELSEALAERQRILADLQLTELRAPINGTVLRLNSRPGERPGEDGVLELAASEHMQALLEVYESDINRVRLGQSVTLTSENGGFSGQLSGRVVRISPQVRQRQVLSTDPTQDADARIVEVRVELDPEDAQRVRRLTGLKVIARLQP